MEVLLDKEVIEPADLVDGLTIEAEFENLLKQAIEF